MTTTKNISVTVRVRPEPVDTASKGLTVDEASSNITIRMTNNQAAGSTAAGDTVQYDFPFDQILDEKCNQEKVFRLSGTSIVDDAMNGFNGSVLSYGQTGAGKTYTMSGPPTDSPTFDEGFIVRSAKYLFQKIRQTKDATFSVKLSILEIYNETLIDLLREITSPRQVSPHTVLPPIVPFSNPQSSSNTTGNNANPTISTTSMQNSQGTVAFGYGMSTGSKLSIIESSNGVSVPGLCILSIKHEKDVSAYLTEVNKVRNVAEHQLNKRSSRSHVIYTFYITKTRDSDRSNAEDEEEFMVTSKLNLVDLAGSERVEKTGASGSVQKEASYINKSLSFLEQVALALSLKKDHIPYRQSKLTLLLKDSFGGNCNTLLIACIWPSQICEYETLSTLRFAARMKCIENRPVRNSLVSNALHGRNADTSTISGLPAKLRSEINYLRRELTLRDMMLQSNRSNGNKEVSGDDKGKDEQTLEEIYESRNGLMDLAIDIASEERSADSLWIETQREINVASYKELKLLCGILRNVIWEASGQDNGQVQENVRKTMERMKEENEREYKLATHPEPSNEESIGSMSQSNPIPFMSYEEYIQGPGKMLNESYQTTKETMRTNKLRQKEIISIINRQKTTIDEIQQSLDNIRDSIDEANEDGSIESQTEQLRSMLEKAKADYITARNELELFKKQYQEAEALKKTIMATLVQAYEEYGQTVAMQQNQKDSIGVEGLD